MKYDVSIHHLVRKPFLVPLVALAVALCLAATVSANLTPAAASSSSAQAAPRVPSAAEAEPAAEAGEASEAAEAGEGESDDWLFDEVRELRYKVDRLPRVEGTYRWIDESKTRVRLPAGAEFEVVRHDPDWFYVKVFEPSERKPQPIAPAGGTEAEQREVAAKYETELESVDRLRLRPFDQGLPTSGQWRNGFDVADVDGDGELDIVFGPARKGRMQPNVFLGDGAGRWRYWREAGFPAEPYDYGDAAVGDFDGDGRVDVAFGFHLRGMLAIVRDGENGFRTWSKGIGIDHPGRGGDATSFSSRAVDVIDWNRDGRLDIIALGEGPKGLKTGKQFSGQLIDTARGYLVYLNQGDGSWKPFSPQGGDVSEAERDFGDAFTIGDFNGDGHPDLVSASQRMGNTVVLSLGDGEGIVTAAAIEGLRPRALLTAVTAADLDGDGLDELFVGYTNHELEIWRTGIDLLSPSLDADSGKLSWERRPLIAEESNKGVTALATGDLDGDGRHDLVGLTGAGEVWLFLGTEDGSFERETSPELPAPQLGCQGFEAHLVDLDGDGSDELIAAFAGEVVGFTALPGLSEPGCRGEGSLRAWKAVSSSAR